MIPYVEHPTWEIGGYTLQAFRLLALAAIVVQVELTVRRAPGVGIARETASALILWAVVLGLASAHVFDVLAYRPHVLREDPLELFRVWGELSSTGGMLGGLAGLFLVARRRGLAAGEIARFFDVVMFALPFTLAVGRFGCALQHDHLGIASTSVFAVSFPEGAPWGGPRFDLGLLEALLCLAIGAAFLLLDRARPQQLRAPGFFAALFFALYGPGRFALDFLRVGEARYAGLTPAQWLMLGASLAALGWLVRKRAATP
ncbi:MAG: prolipoprotein diacylglyceryl transferase [Deltaproteobacteria bacterium]|nr:prolipoprotein diacylglyceryl transferase [Deltaproteobacteria bacterium]